MTSTAARRATRSVLVATVAALAIGMAVSATAEADTFLVQFPTADAVPSTPPCSKAIPMTYVCPTLRAAVAAADATGGSNAIALADTSVATLTLGELDVTGTLAIEGGAPATTIIDGGGLDRVFNVADGASLTLKHLAIQNGKVTGAGAAIETNTAGAVALEDVTLANNTASAGTGGAIDSHGGPVTVTASTISGNAASSDGGGIYAANPTAFELIGTTIARNRSASGAGGGIALATSGIASIGAAIVNTTVFANTAAAGGGGIRADVGPDSLTITNATIVGNASTAGAGGNLWANGGSGGGLNVQNTIVGAGSAAGAPDNCALQPIFHDLGNNLFFDAHFSSSSTDNCFGPNPTGPHDVLAADPSLAGGPGLATDSAGNILLAVNDSQFGQAYGSRVPTIALVPGSPALDHASTVACKRALPTGAAGVDERGISRFPFVPYLTVTTCDVGAFELEPPPPPPVTIFSGSFQHVGPTQPASTASTAQPAAAKQTAKQTAKSVACASQRHFRIHIQHVQRFQIVSAVIYVAGKKRATVSGKRLNAAVDLRRRPSGKFHIRIVARQRNGHVLIGIRTYHTCHAKLPGHKFLLL